MTEHILHILISEGAATTMQWGMAGELVVLRRGNTFYMYDRTHFTHFHRLRVGEGDTVRYGQYLCVTLSLSLFVSFCIKKRWLVCVGGGHNS